MKLSIYKKQHKKLETLTDEQIEAIFELIDLKTEEDMEKVLQKMETIKNDLIKWLIATIIASVGIIIAIIKI